MSVAIYGELHHRRLLFLFAVLTCFHTADFHFIANQDLVHFEAKVDVWTLRSLIVHAGLR